MHVRTVRLLLASVELVTLLMNQRKLNCSVVNVKMEDLVRQMMQVTWFADADKTLKEHTAMNMFREVEFIQVQIQVPSFQHSSFLFASFLVLDSTFSSKRNNCKFIWKILLLRRDVLTIYI